MSQHPLFGLTLRDYLAGAWRIDRRIDDRRADGKGRFEGDGVFSPMQSALLYREAGTLSIAGHAHDARQQYRWRFPADDTAHVAFADGRPFHTVTLDRHAAEADHHCTPDDYAVSYRFDSIDIWHQEWRVSGPRKNYTSRSVFTRLHRSPGSLVSAE